MLTTARGPTVRSQDGTLMAGQSLPAFIPLIIIILITFGADTFSARYKKNMNLSSMLLFVN